MRAVLATAPAGLLTDIDGTLAPIVADPSNVRALPQAAAALLALTRKLAVVAAVSGRAALDARRMLGEAGRAVLIVGNHGLEWLEPGNEVASSDASHAPLRAGIIAALAALPEVAGVTIEDKGLSATIHYRRTEDAQLARTRILQALDRVVVPSTGLTLREGRMSVELRPATGDKGTATRVIVERYGLRGLLIAGDDVTDLDMFRTARTLAAEAGLRAIIVAIGAEREVPAEVTSAADAVMRSPQEFAALLARLADG